MRIDAFLTGVSDSLGLLAYNIKQQQAIHGGADCIHYTPSMAKCCWLQGSKAICVRGCVGRYWLSQLRATESDLRPVDSGHAKAQYHAMDSQTDLEVTHADSYLRWSCHVLMSGHDGISVKQTNTRLMALFQDDLDKTAPERLNQSGF